MSSKSAAVPTPLAKVKGKVAFVTGGSSGIGLGIARVLSAAGMKVVFTYRSAAHRDLQQRLLVAPLGKLARLVAHAVVRVAIAGRERAAQRRAPGAVHALDTKRQRRQG
jgi:NAD(P)-dependent dehydrogenase (short-subunit alcohol dehydrogenase family)